ncbi:hypothetical protein PRIPAC_92675 [Pristionchus pacificus]|uniref:Uncharacterized protein n=1 Tax=Pristionchus pacificus TaxID=54126 RepID=A0A2A6BAW6_PRIPA|nr:hypothetical protein PRIPAC_92675 [Pristionchus pacificus]|eukprot:PDM63018.1 hypothetical protein PRIPAC_50233 [Pristionchus pacificus]
MPKQQLDLIDYASPATALVLFFIANALIYLLLKYSCCKRNEDYSKSKKPHWRIRVVPQSLTRNAIPYRNPEVV